MTESARANKNRMILQDDFSICLEEDNSMMMMGVGAVGTYTLGNGNNGMIYESSNNL